MEFARLSEDGRFIHKFCYEFVEVLPGQLVAMDQISEIENPSGACRIHLKSGEVIDPHGWDEEENRPTSPWTWKQVLATAKTLEEI